MSIDPDLAIERAPDWVRDALRRNLPEVEMASRDIEASIDGEGRIRRVEYLAPPHAITFDFWAFGDPPRFTTAAADTVVDAAELGSPSDHAPERRHRRWPLRDKRIWSRAAGQPTLPPARRSSRVREVQDMPETELLLSLAEIAGVFLGFGALISIRSASTREAFELTYIRAVVTMGTQVVVAALVPLTLGHYDITGHEVWLLSSLVFLVVTWGMFALEGRVPESRAIARATPWARRAVSAVLWVPETVALILVVLGLFPNQEPALYLTAVGLHLVMAASFLLSLAYSFGRPKAA